MPGPDHIREQTDRYTVGNYGRTPIAFVRGQGSRLYDSSGQPWLDMLSGIGCTSLGHCHPRLVEAIRDQAGRLIHTSNLYHHEPGAEVARRLVENTFADRAFFCNSGAEAIEAAIKFARRAAGGRHEIVAAHGSFHGRTLGALAATGQPALQEGFGPMPGGFVHVPFGDAAAAAEAVSESTAAVLVEPIQGESGVVTPPPGYLEELRRICTERGALLIFDEVQTGNGRTGTLYACEQAASGFGPAETGDRSGQPEAFRAVTPDILATAKGLAGGLPIGAVLTTEAIAAAMVPGTHGTTFGANPVVCRAALVVLEELLDNGLLAEVRQRSRDFFATLRSELSGCPGVREIRGAGLMVGIVLDRPAAPSVTALLEHRVLANAAGGNVIRLLPPLTTPAQELDEAAGMLLKVLG